MSIVKVPLCVVVSPQPGLGPASDVPPPPESALLPVSRASLVAFVSAVRVSTVLVSGKGVLVSATPASDLPAVPPVPLPAAPPLPLPAEPPVPLPAEPPVALVPAEPPVAPVPPVLAPPEPPVTLEPPAPPEPPVPPEPPDPLEPPAPPEPPVPLEPPVAPLVVVESSAEQWMTPTTPAITHTLSQCILLIAHPLTLRARLAPSTA
jgi:hypothetical protein